MEKTAVNRERRKFLTTAKYAGALGVVAVLGKKIETPVPQADPVTEPTTATSAYHETDHIRKYYRYAGLL